MTDCQPSSCKFCEKKGLAILPQRYAVARTDLKGQQALTLAGTFKAPVADITLPPSTAEYTQRLLRPGYLYVFNVVRGEWKGYIVTPRGFLYEFVTVLVKGDKTIKVGGSYAPPPDAGDIQFTCHATADESVARCVAIPDAAHAGDVWMGFSDTAWTETVFQQNRSAAARQKHMAVINVQDWVSGTTDQPGTQPFSQLTNVVNEFTREGVPPAEKTAQSQEPDHPAFDYSPHAFYGMDFAAKRFASWGEEQTDMPAMVALPDAVGITMELSALTGALQETFLDKNKGFEEPLAIATLIGSLEDGIRRQAIFNELEERHKMIKRKLRGYIFGVIHGPAVKPHAPADLGGDSYVLPIAQEMRQIVPQPLYGTVKRLAQEAYQVSKARWQTLQNAYDKGMDDYRQSMRQENSKYSAYQQSKVAEIDALAWQCLPNSSLTTGALNDAATDAWDDYGDQLNAGEPGNWLKNTYNAQLTKYDKAYVVPLADAQVAWFNSASLQAVFDAHYDSADIHTGVAYTHTLLMCILDSQTTRICFDNYVDLLKAETDNPDNIIQRGLVYNSQTLQDAVSSAVPTAGVASDKLPKLPWESLLETYQTVTKPLQNMGESTLARFISALGGPLTVCLKQIGEGVVCRAVIKLGVAAELPIVMTTHQGSQWDALRLWAEGLKQSNPAFKQVDSRELTAMLAIQLRGNTSPADSDIMTTAIDLARLSLVTADDDTDLTAAIQQAVNNPETISGLLQSGIGAAGDVANLSPRGSLVALLLYSVNTTWDAVKLDKAASENNGKQVRNFAISGGILVGAMMEEGAKRLEAAVDATLPRLVRNNKELFVKFLRGPGELFGFAAGVATAYFEFQAAETSWHKGHYGMMALHITEGVSTLGASLMFSRFGSSLVRYMAPRIGVRIAMILAPFLPEGVAAASTGWGILLVVASVIIAALIALFTQNDLQNWLEKCRFGDNSFPSYKKEMQQLRHILEKAAPATVQPVQQGTG